LIVCRLGYLSGAGFRKTSKPCLEVFLKKPATEPFPLIRTWGPLAGLSVGIAVSKFCERFFEILQYKVA
jgi:hypothetical protein